MADNVTFKDGRPKWILPQGYKLSYDEPGGFVEVPPLSKPFPNGWRPLQGEGFSVTNPETFPAPTVLDIYAPRIIPGFQRDPRDAEIERLQEEAAYWRDQAEERAAQIRAERLMRSPDPYYVTVDSRGVITGVLPDRQPKPPLPPQPKPAPRFLVDAEQKPKRKFRL